MTTVITRGAGSAQALGYAAHSTAANYIEDVFSTYLYTGNGSTQTITNGIDLAGKGGLTWIKSRTTGFNHTLIDTVRGATNLLVSNTTAAQATQANSLTAFTSTGFSIGAGSIVNFSADNFASWTFRKQPKFFDIVTYTGNGANRTIAHNLESVPGSIIVKRTDVADNWAVYHRSLANTQYLVLNSTAAAATGTTWWNSTTPTSTVFSLGTEGSVNASGGTYVAYLFAHNAGGFGLSGTDNVISCGSYTGNGSASGPTVTLGYEPQWVMVKRTTDGIEDWEIYDTMRGIVPAGADKILYPNDSGQEQTATRIQISATGFSPDGTAGSVNENGKTYIYIAIRRGLMEVPTSGTSVFLPSTRAGTGASVTTSNLSFPPDAVWSKGQDNGGTNSGAFDRLRGAKQQLSLNQTDAETNASTSLTGFDVMTGYTAGADAVELTINATGYNYVNWQFRRAPGFFDIVCYTGTSVAMTVAHNLTVPPELVIVKSRSNVVAWPVWSKYGTQRNDYLINLNGQGTYGTAGDLVWGDPGSGVPNMTSTVFSVGDAVTVNNNTWTYVAYLFATVAGVSKVGSYTGTGTTQVINCGFTSGARFILIKRIDSTGGWHVWDSARGIVAGNDPYLLLNSTAAEVTNTDYVDTAASGFEISSTAPAAINANGGSFIFLAIA